MSRISVQTTQVYEASAKLSISPGRLEQIMFTFSNLSSGHYHSTAFACSGLQFFFFFLSLSLLASSVLYPSSFSHQDPDNLSQMDHPLKCPLAQPSPPLCLMDCIAG